MKRKLSILVLLAAAVLLGLALAYGASAAGLLSPARQASGPPVRIDGAGALFSGVDGPLVSNAAFRFEPSSYPPNRLTQADVDNVPRGWDRPATAPARIGDPGIEGGTVKAIAVGEDGYVYVGGDFTSVGGNASMRYLARWNAFQGWSALGGGVNGPVRALAVAPNGDLYAGGEFTAPGNRIARWDGSRWHALGGLNGTVHALAVAPNGDLYAGGEFTATIADPVVSVRGIARRRGSSWDDVGGGVSTPSRAPGSVNALAMESTDLYVGGNFSDAGDESANYVARWDSAWDGANGGWEGLGSPAEYVVDALATNGSGLYVASRTSINGGYRVHEYDMAARQWRDEPLAESSDDKNRIYAIVAGQKDVFAGGTLAAIGGRTASSIARWNVRTRQWHRMGAGVTQGKTVHALASHGADVYAGGDFTTAGGQLAGRIARWVQPVADLSVWQRASPAGQVPAGGQIAYQIVVRHNGYHTASGVRLVGALPAGVAFGSASDGGAYDPGSHTVTWSLGPLASGASATRSLTVDVSPELETGTVLVHVVRVEADPYDPVVEIGDGVGTFNRHVLESTVYAQASLTLTKSAPQEVDVNEELLYRLTVTNDGPSTASSVRLTDDLPPGVKYVTSPGCSGNDTQVICELGTMAAGTAKRVEITVIPLVVGQSVNRAEVSAPQAAQPATATATTTVAGEVGLGLSKSDYTDEVGLNEPLTYVIEAWNSGEGQVPDVQIVDQLPDAVDLRSVESSKGTCTGAPTIVCEIGALDSIESVTVTLVVLPTREGQLSNTATLSGQGVDPVSRTDDDTWVWHRADLRLTMAASDAATTGHPFAYTIQVVNDGPASADGVVLTDDLPDGLRLNAATPSQGSCTFEPDRVSARVTCELGRLGNGESADVSIEVIPLAPGAFQNTARVDSPVADDEPGNNQKTVPTSAAGTAEAQALNGLEIEAYTFLDLGGGRTLAYGVVSLGPHFYLSGLNDSVEFDNDDLTASGALTLKEGDLPIFDGAFGASAPDWALVLGDGASTLPGLAGFALEDSNLSAVSLLTGQVSGSTGRMHIAPPGNDVVVSADFGIAPGPPGSGRPAFSGTIEDAFSLSVGAFQVQVPTSAPLSNDGIRVESIDLIMPAYFGGGSVPDAELLIKPDSLQLGGMVGAGFSVPDLRFDNQEALVITGGTGGLRYVNDTYRIEIDGSQLKVTLPGNRPSIPLGGIMMHDNGRLEAGALPAFTLQVAGATLTVEGAELVNEGLSVPVADLRWPDNLGGGNRSVLEVSIAPDGALALAGGGDVTGDGDVALPDIPILGGETLRVNRPVAALVEEADGYSFDVRSGKVQVRLPQQNDHSLLIAAGVVDVEGHFYGRFAPDTLTLDVSGAELAISGLSSGWPLNDVTGLSIVPAGSATEPSTAQAIGQGSWKLPSSLGGGVLSFDAPIVIDDDGLHLNDGNPVPFPDATLDDGGFPVLNNLVTLLVADDRTYELNVASTISVTIPGAGGMTDADLWLDSLGRFSGAAAGLALPVGGLLFETDGFDVEGGQLRALGGTLQAPPGFGGDQIVVNDMAILDADLGMIGFGVDDQGNVTSATVELPSLTLNGYDVFALEGSFQPVDRLPIGDPDGVDDGYEITGHGLIKMPGFSTSLSPDPPKPGGGHSVSCSGFEVSFRLVVGMEGRTQLTVVPASNAYLAVPVTALAGTTAVEGRTQPAVVPASNAYLAVPVIASGGPTAQAGRLRLVEVAANLQCAIPIPELLIEVASPRIHGGWDGDRDMVYAGGGITVRTMAQVLGHNVASGDVDLGVVVTPDWQTVDMTGTLTILDLWKQMAATAHIGLDQGVPTDLEAQLTINQMPWMPPFYPIPMVGIAGFHAWTDWSPANPSDVDLSYFHFTGWASLDIGFPEGIVWTGCTDLGLFEACIAVPPMDLYLVGVSAEVGEFRANSDSVWGLKAEVRALNGLFSTGMYIDAEGNLDFGDVSGYILLDSEQMKQIQQAWLAAQQGEVNRAEIADLELFSFAPQTITRTVPVTTAADLVFAMTRSSEVPTLTLVSPSGVEIAPGSTPSGTMHLETYTETTDVEGHTVPLTQTTYVVQEAEVGDWQVVLHGDVGEEDRYVLNVIGAQPAPTLTEVSATSTGPTGVDVSWRLASEEPSTVLNIHATSGPITATYTMTHTDGITETITRPIYVDAPVAEDVPTPLDGTPANTSLDLSHLESGTYRVWAEANDLHNPPVRVHAPESITVDHSATWPLSWTPTITVTPDYLGLQIFWDPLRHPDTDGYVVYVSDSPLAEPPLPPITEAITTPYASTFVPTWLEPGETYYVVVSAYDGDSGRSVRAPQVTGVPLPAAFELATPTPSITVVGGSSTGVEVRVVQTGDVTPTVGLYAATLPDGLDMAFTSSRWVTPTLDGSPVSLVISATDTMPGGAYTARIAAVGGGRVATLDLQVAVDEPTFELAAEPAVVTLGEGQSATVTLSASGLNGESDPIHLELAGAPQGLLWSLSSDIVHPGEAVTLVLTDTFLVSHGLYDLHVSGDDGENEVDRVVSLRVDKPGFSLASVEPRYHVLIGETTELPLRVAPEHGWTEPVTLTLEADTLPPDSTGGLATTPTGSPQDTLSVTPPQIVYLIVDTGPATPEDVYLLTVDGKGGARKRSLDLELWVLATLPPPPSWYPIHLSEESYSVTEDRGPALIAVTLGITNTYADVSVAYATTDGTATAGEDYTAVSGVVTITAGSLGTAFSVPITDDAVDEGSETVLLGLSNPNGGTLARPSSGVLTIVDQDTAAVAVAPTTVHVTEAGETDAYQVALATQPTDIVTVTATTDGQTTVDPPIALFTPLDWDRPRTVTVTAVDDDVVEGKQHMGLIAHQATSGDPNYAGLTVVDVTVYIEDNDNRLYLPLIIREQASLAPDLVVDSITATRDSVQVVIRNQGGVPVVDEFWTEVYIDPHTVPTAVNQNWPMVGDHGVVWGVTADVLPALVPGGTITLTMGDAHYWPEYSSFPETLAPGTPVYAQVDSTDHDTTYGAVLETHEISGGPYNNIAGATATAALLEPTDGGSEGKRRRAGGDGLPPWR